MSIVYASLARGKTVLADSTTVSGNFEVVARMLLGKLADQAAAEDAESGGAGVSAGAGGDAETTPLRGARDGEGAGAYASATRDAGPRLLKFENDSQYTFFVSAKRESSERDAEPLVVLCLADKAAPARVAFAFLAEVRERFVKAYKPAEWERAIAYSFNAEFSGVLAQQMERFNGDGAQDERVRRVRGQLDDLKDVMVKNIDALLNRGEALEVLVESTDRLQQAAFKFEKASERAAQLMWWKKVRCRAAAAALVLFTLLVLIVIGCGGLDFSSCA